MVIVTIPHLATVTIPHLATVMIPHLAIVAFRFATHLAIVAALGFLGVIAFPFLFAFFHIFRGRFPGYGLDEFCFNKSYGNVGFHLYWTFYYHWRELKRMVKDAWKGPKNMVADAWKSPPLVALRRIFMGVWKVPKSFFSKFPSRGRPAGNNQTEPGANASTIELGNVSGTN